ncbi:MAG: nuclease-related domain-containing protein [Kiritimatiellia bacterium]
MTDRINRVEVHGTPGEGARARGICKAIFPLIVCVFLFGVFTGLLIPVEASAPVLFGFAGVFVLVLWLAWDFYDGVSSYFKGARGEEIVAVQLSGGLPAGYHVFHDLELRGVSPIDHLVVGPSGVFVIETKFWSGRVSCSDGMLLVDGGNPSRSPVEQADVEVKALREWFSAKMNDVPPIIPVVCFAGNNFDGSAGEFPFQLRGVGVCNVNDICSFILAGKADLSPVGIESVIKVLEF